MSDDNDKKRCGHEWKDGWGDHTCAKFMKDHGSPNRHTCDCDAQLMIREQDDS